MNFFWIFIGGGLGSVLRYAFVILFNSKPFAAMPTFFVNAIGSFLLGVMVAFFSKQSVQNDNIVLALTIGLCGGFTTFSTFSLELINLLKSGLMLQALIYALSSVLISCLLLFVGWKLVA